MTDWARMHSVIGRQAPTGPTATRAVHAIGGECSECQSEHHKMSCSKAPRNRSQRGPDSVLGLLQDIALERAEVLRTIEEDVAEAVEAKEKAP